MLDGLKKSEIKKVESAANKFYGRKDCKLTGYCASKSDVPEFYDVQCEICFGYSGPRADHDVLLSVFLLDRRKSFATVKTW